LTKDDIFEIHRIVYVDDSSVKIGFTQPTLGTYTTTDENGKLTIVANLNELVQVRLTAKQELCVYKHGHKEETKQSLNVHVKEFIECSSELSAGCFIVGFDNKVSGMF
jgi:hypothetical protein